VTAEPPPCASSAHRRRFQKAKPLAAAVRSAAIHRPFPSGAGGVTAEPPPCASSAHRRRFQKAKPLAAVRSTAIHRPLPSGGGAVTAEPPLCSLPNEIVFNMCSLNKVQKITKNFEKPIDISQKPWYNRIKIKELQHFIQAELPIGN
ncbi:MAG: hypothetical protein IJN11_06100, partial [Oscillospiraceae bacterium]|nr:hypothetical protein [Oscillospiraceae bacterium]